jgi:hypothetical protein
VHVRITLIPLQFALRCERLRRPGRDGTKTKACKGRCLQASGRGRHLDDLFLDCETGDRGIADPVDKTSMFGIFLAAPEIIRRRVVVSDKVTAKVELERIGEQPKQQFAWVALANKGIQCS